jgi:hypothetical protein
MSETPTESERRLRAALRALLSQGVWLTIVFELAVSLVPQIERLDELGSGKFALLGLFAALAVYLQAGTMWALAGGRDTVPAAQSLLQGKDAFPRFIWLMLRAGFLLFVLLNVALFLLNVTGLIAIEEQAAVPTFATVIAAVIMPLKYVLAFWLPFVFVRQEFRLLPGLQAALRLARAQFARAGLFLALLLLVPGLALLALPTGMPLPLLAVVMLIAVLLDWIAYSYCVEVVREPAPTAPTP